jgi:hydroxymethylpyrimidine/phosphomethylpyrimidine kinase
VTTPPVVLTIAGSDSGGGAGVQADLRTFAALGVHGTTAITAVTAQNTVAVREVHVVPASVVDSQIEAVTEDLAPAAAKTGLLPTAAIVEVVVRRAAAGLLPPLVVDPVLVASTGRVLVEPDTLAAVRRTLVPLATVLTPNLFEAGLLVGRTLETLDDMRAAAEELRGAGAGVVVVKGGHRAACQAVDVVAYEGGLEELAAAFFETRNVHGTGCTLSAATAAGLARGLSPLDAVRDAKAFVTRAIEGAVGWRLGAGHGPLDHLGWSSGRGG